jgi:hypothetical protein
LPATSLAPVLTTALYLAPLARLVVFEEPKGSSVAVSPSALRLTLTLVICVVPLEVTFNSLKVVGFREEVIIASEKVAVRLAEGATPVALAAGEVLVTLGEVVSDEGGGGGGGGGGGVLPHSAARQASPEQALRASRRPSRAE